MITLAFCPWPGRKGLSTWDGNDMRTRVEVIRPVILTSSHCWWTHDLTENISDLSMTRLKLVALINVPHSSSASCFLFNSVSESPVLICFVGHFLYAFKNNQYQIPVGSRHHLSCLIPSITVSIKIHCEFPKKYVHVFGDSKADQQTQARSKFPGCGQNGEGCQTASSAFKRQWSFLTLFSTRLSTL